MAIGEIIQLENRTKGLYVDDTRANAAAVQNDTALEVDRETTTPSPMMPVTFPSQSPIEEEPSLEEGVQAVLSQDEDHIQVQVSPTQRRRQVPQSYEPRDTVHTEQNIVADDIAWSNRMASAPCGERSIRKKLLSDTKKYSKYGEEKTKKINRSAHLMGVPPSMSSCSSTLQKSRRTVKMMLRTVSSSRK